MASGAPSRARPRWPSGSRAPCRMLPFCEACQEGCCDREVLFALAAMMLSSLAHRLDVHLRQALSHAVEH
eukprot:13886457-Alexandrium_andersonii.AAC.1